MAGPFYSSEEGSNIDVMDLQPMAWTWAITFRGLGANAMLVYSDKNGCLTFSVRVVPRASRSEIVGEHDGALRVRLAAPPVEGAANEELVRLLARSLGVSRSAIEIRSGQTAKLKVIRVTGVTPSALADLSGANPRRSD